MNASRVCRVVPDVPAVDRAFDYVVPDELADRVAVGTIVRVRLAGRRVRGWVVDDDVAPVAGTRLLPIDRVSSAGPPPEVVALTTWAARRWAGPRVAFLRAASPPNRVRSWVGTHVPAGRARLAVPADADARAADALAEQARGHEVAVVRWPPALDRRRLVAGLLAERGSTLVIAPGRVEPLTTSLRATGAPVAALSGELDAAARTAAWDDARRPGAVVVGGRVAAWAPVPELGAAIVLDEDDEALVAERAPTWHARDVVLERARRTGARAVLVSSVPSVEALEAGTLLVPERAVERRGWPPVEVVDRREEPPGAGLFSPALVDALHAVVQSGGGVWCVLNRRGRARLLSCRSCGELARCETCGAAVQETEGELACPRCGATRPVVCERCGSTALRRLRPGVTRVAEELDALLPRTRVGLVDHATETAPDVPVIVGTEALLHRGGSPPGLVAFLDFDAELLAPRFRAAAQAYWLLVRAARAVGLRGRGRLLIQTRVPGHEVIEAARHADPERAARVEAARRRSLHLPPFGALAEVSGSPAAMVVARSVLSARTGVEISGPTTGPGERERSLVRADDPAVLLGALAEARAASNTADRGVRIDVDPVRA